MRELISIGMGFIFWFPVIIALIISNTYFTNINVDFSLTKSYEEQYNTLQDNYEALENKLNDQRQIVCECKSDGSLASLFWGFFVGALAMGYFILVGYPWLKKKVEEKK